MMNLTKEQAAIVDAKMQAGDATKVIAYAGTGKTSTFVAYADAHYPDPMLYLAFNKSVETEAKERFPNHVKAKTVHALAWAACGKNYERFGNVRHFDVMKRLKLDVYAATLVGETLENWLNSADQEITKQHAAEDWQKRYQVDITGDLCKSAKLIWREMVAETKPFMMTHSGYLKLYQLSQPRIPHRTIMLDEAQDTNPVTFDIVNRQRQFGTKVLLAGDPYQQIYSWRGAVDAMATQDCQSFRLTQSWRFGPNVARVANTILKTFFNEQVPVVGNGDDMLVSAFPENEVYTIICRTNLELFKQAVGLVLANKQIHVIGDQGFQQYLAGVMDVYYVFSRQLDQIQDRSLLFYRNYDDLKRYATDRKDMELLSRCAIVEKYANTVPRHVESIRKANVPQRFAKVVLVTAHKSKGLEWDNVMLAPDFSDLLDDCDCPVLIKEHVRADKTIKDEKQRKALLEDAVDRDEINLVYVAATRAKKRLMVNNEVNRLLNWEPLPEPAPALHNPAMT